MDTALERLNRWREGKLPIPISYTAGSAAFSHDVTELLSEIERLRAENERLRAENERFKATLEHIAAFVSTAADMAHDARAALKSN
jgi:regulator of replication initiation timing